MIEQTVLEGNRMKQLPLSAGVRCLLIFRLVDRHWLRAAEISSGYTRRAVLEAMDLSTSETEKTR
jgi:hypothetical protein